MPGTRTPTWPSTTWPAGSWRWPISSSSWRSPRLISPACSGRRFRARLEEVRGWLREQQQSRRGAERQLNQPAAAQYRRRPSCYTRAPCRVTPIAAQAQRRTSSPLPPPARGAACSACWRCASDWLVRHVAERQTGSARSLRALQPHGVRIQYKLDHALLRPVAREYVKVTPLPIRTAVNNFLTNLAYPTTIVNQFLQGKVNDGVGDTARLVVNTTLGHRRAVRSGESDGTGPALEPTSARRWVNGACTADRS